MIRKATLLLNQRLTEAAESLAHQLDPQSMAEVIVNVALDDNSNFRNVHPKETEEFNKTLQAEAWTAKS